MTQHVKRKRRVRPVESEDERLRPISMYPLTPEQALKGAMDAGSVTDKTNDPEDEEKPEKPD